MPKTSIYNQLRSLTNSYFEIGSQSFLDDLIKHHIDIDPRELKAHELKLIIDWLEIAAWLLTSDSRAKAYKTKISQLADGT